MAPKALKRPAAAGAASAKGPKGKHAKLAEDSFETKTKMRIEAVSDAIASYQGLEDSTKNLLCSIVAHSLPILKSDRHAYEISVIEMVGETMDAMKQQLATQVENIQSKVDNAESEKLKIEETEKAAAAEVEKLKGLLDSAKEAMDIAGKANDEAHEALVAASTEQSFGNLSFNQLSERRALVESTFKDIFTPLQSKKAQSLEDAKDLKSLCKVCSEHQFDSTLISSLPEALKKEPADRGTFDKVVVKHTEEAFGTCLASMQAELEALAPAKMERAAVVGAKSTELAAAAEKFSASKEAYENALAALEAGSRAHTETKEVVAGFADKVKADVEALAAAKVEFEEFASGPMQAFLDCKDMEAPPPVPEPPAVEPAAVTAPKDDEQLEAPAVTEETAAPEIVEKAPVEPVAMEEEAAEPAAM